MEFTIREAEIVSQENKLYAAILSGDIEKLDELLYKDLLFILPGGEVIDKETDLNTYRNGKLTVESLVPEIENIQIIDDLAIVIVKMELKGRYGGLPFGNHYRYIRFWKKMDDRIMVIGGSGSAI